MTARIGDFDPHAAERGRRRLARARAELQAPDVRTAAALERIADAAELVVDRLELALEMIPIPSHGDELDELDGDSDG